MRAVELCPVWHMQRGLHDARRRLYYAGCSGMNRARGAWSMYWS